MSSNKTSLNPYFDNNNNYEIGIDEAGRGPMFGRVYSAAVILPKDNSFNHSLMKDSKKFHSEKKLKEASDYIKQNCIAYSIHYKDEKVIDKINIRQANFQCMHNCIKEIQFANKNPDDFYLLVDGNDFKSYTYIDNTTIKQLPYTCIKGGDNLYTSIAAASILAKVARDEYINDICERNPFLKNIYDLHNNKGYGTKKHMDAIKKYGISEWHRKTYGICAQSNYIDDIYKH